MEGTMSTAKQDVEELLSKLPDDCSVEDIQYHLSMGGRGRPPHIPALFPCPPKHRR